jgi:3-methyladenine DNA glycosylase AlkC
MTDKSLKNFYNQSVVEDIAARVGAAYKPFKREVFVAEIMRELPALELKARALCIAAALRKHLPSEYEKAIAILLQSLGNDDGSGGVEGMGGFKHLPFLNFVGQYGLEQPELSLKALHQMTKYFSAEFDIRPFLLAHRDLAFSAAHSWAKDKDWRVRRLASEGTRPRLPWGLRLKELVADPVPILPILDTLYTDPHPVVRRSVANSLNDISKDHPALAVKIAKRWKQENDTPETLQLIRHALRGLRKIGDKETLELFGFAHGTALSLADFALEKNAVAIGDAIGFSVTLASKEAKSVRMEIQYAVHHQRKNGKTSAKIFKLAEREIVPGKNLAITSKHSFKEITTRRYYPGEHKIEILAGGVSLGEKRFTLKARKLPSA